MNPRLIKPFTLISRASLLSSTHTPLRVIGNSSTRRFASNFGQLESTTLEPGPNTTPRKDISSSKRTESRTMSLLDDSSSDSGQSEIQVDDGITNLVFHPIPSIPPPVSGYPTPWFEEEDAEQYLIPLYSRGWGVTFKKNKRKPPVNREATSSKPPPPERHTAHLVVEYEFDDYPAAITFVNDVGGLATSEDHHPRMVNIRNAKNPTVTIMTQTDSAKRPLWDQPNARKIRGLTLRDLRLAMLVETLYTEKYGHGRDATRMIRPLNQRPPWPRLLRSLQKYSLNSTPDPIPQASPTGPPSGSLHNPDPEIDQSKTTQLCNHCGMNHPSEICPHNRPVAPCPNCGGPHWLADCQVPQAP